MRDTGIYAPGEAEQRDLRRRLAAEHALVDLDPACADAVAVLPGTGSFDRMANRVSSLVVRRLRDAADAGLTGTTTPQSRLALVEILTREAWSLAGRDVPVYDRCDAPISVRPLRPDRLRDRSAGG